MALDNGTQETVKPDEGFNIIKAAAQQRASNTQAAVDVHSLMDQQQEAFRSAEFAATTVGNSNEVISSAQESWKAASDAKKSAQNLALGFDPLDAGSKSNYWIQQMHENATKSYAALDVVNQSRSKTLLNDPLGFIAAQFTLPADVAAQHYYADKYNVAESSLNEIISASNASSIAINSSQQTTSQATAVALADKASAEAAKNVAELKINAAGTQTKGILEINSLSEKQLQQTIQIHASQTSDAHLALAQKAQAENHEFHVARMGQIQEAIDLKTANQQQLAESLITRNIGAKIMGRPPIGSVAEFLKENSQQGKNPIYQDMMAAGSNSQFNGGNVIGVPIAENAGNAARNYASGGVNLTGNVAGSFLADVWNKQKGLATSPKDVQALASHVNDIAVAAAKSELSSIDNSNPLSRNIYAAPVPAVVTEIAGVKANPFLAATVLPMIAQDPKLTISDATMLGKAVEFAKTGSPDTAGMGSQGNFNAAADGIVTYYNAAVVKNTAINRYTENGLPPQTSYIANINGSNYDLTKVADVKRAIFMADKGALTGFPVADTVLKASARTAYSITSRLTGQ